MATAADKNSRSPAQKSAAPAAKGGSKLPLIISAVAVLAAAGAGGGWYWSSSKAAAAEHAAAEAAKPKLPAPAQYLQVEIQLMTRDAVALSDLERHAPAIRARLLMLLAQQDAQGIADRAGKEKLQAQALAEVRKLMRAETGKPGVEDLLFTSFVTQ